MKFLQSAVILVFASCFTTFPGARAAEGQSPSTDPNLHAQHAAHVAAGSNGSPAQDPNASIVQQLAEMGARVAKVEAALAQQPARMSALPGQSTMPPMDATAHAQHAQHPTPPTQPATGPAQDPNASLVLQLAELSARIGQVEAKLSQTVPPVQPAVDPATHAAHVAAGTMPAAAPAASGAQARDPALEQQLSGLNAKFAQLEAALAKNSPKRPGAAVPGTAPMPGMDAPAAAAAPMAGMSAGDATAGGEMNMQGMMIKMMGMMDKMMSMGAGAPGAGMPMAQSPVAPTPAAPAAPMAGMSAAMPAGGSMKMMGMMDKMMPMGAGATGARSMSMPGGAMPAGAPAPGMGAGGMGMEKMEMAGMMGMGAMSGSAGAPMPQSVLPGFPGASHLYHIGATDFFLDHPQHIALSVEQTAALNKAKEQALLAKSTSDRAIKQAEQELWSLTASDQPDAAKIAIAIHEIGTLTGAARLAFIRAIGESSNILTDEQRKSLTGFAPPSPAMPAAAMAPMKDM